MLFGVTAFSQRQELLNRDYVLVRGGATFSLSSPGAPTSISRSLIGECNIDPFTRMGDPYYRRTEWAYFYLVDDEIASGYPANKSYTPVNLSIENVGNFEFEEHYVRRVCLDGCIDGQLITRNSCSEQSSNPIGSFTVKIVHFEKTEAVPVSGNFLVLQGGDDLVLSDFYSLSDPSESSRIKATGPNVNNGLFQASSAPAGEYLINIQGSFDNGEKAFGLSFKVVDFALSQGSSLDICNTSNERIDLKTFHTLEAEEGLTFSYEGIGIVDGSYLDMGALPEGTTSINMTAEGFVNGPNTLVMDFVKTPLPNISAGEKQFVCQGEILTLSGGSPVGGVWSSAQVPVVDGAIATQSLAAGTYEVTYTVSEGNCSGIASKTIEISPLPFVEAGETLNLCNAALFYNLNEGDHFPKGGSWQALETGISVSNGILNVSTIEIPSEGEKAFFMEYRYQDGQGCVNSDTKKILVYATPEEPQLSQTAICGSGQATPNDRKL